MPAYEVVVRWDGADFRNRSCTVDFSGPVCQSSAWNCAEIALSLSICVPAAEVRIGPDRANDLDPRARRGNLMFACAVETSDPFAERSAIMV